MKFILLCLIAFFSLQACTISEPLLTRESDNNYTYEVDYLFEHEGCRVYRFYDRGHYVYFTNCRGDAVSLTDSTTIRNATRITGN